MEQLKNSLALKKESQGAVIFKALLERQKFISNHLSNGGSIKELKKTGLKFGEIDLRNDISARD